MTIAVLLLIVLWVATPAAGAGDETRPNTVMTRANTAEQAKASAMADLVAQTRREAIDAFPSALQDRERTSAVVRERRRAQHAMEEIRDRQAALDRKRRWLEKLARRRELEAARQAVATVPTPAAPVAPTTSGEWICPVQGPVEFVDSWGYSRSGGRSHKGVDMMASRGTPTVAPVSGRILHKESGLGGLAWYVYGDDGTTYYGAHLSAYASQGVGSVTAGTVIGYVGDSGNARGTNHLHFEVQPNGGSAVNPYPLVAQYC